MNSAFLTAQEVAEILRVSGSYAYKVITSLNQELEQNGYRTVKGKVNRAYFEERYFYKSQTV